MVIKNVERWDDYELYDEFIANRANMLIPTQDRDLTIFQRLYDFEMMLEIRKRTKNQTSFAGHPLVEHALEDQ